MSQPKQISRRNMLFRGTAILSAIILAPLASDSPPARAGTMSKAMLHYQDSPNDGKMCADCTAYTPPASPDAGTGTCKVLAGPVNPQGWCMAFSRR